MHRRLLKQISLWIAGLSLIVCMSVGTLATDLPSGLPKNLSDNSAYEPCLGTFLGQSPPRCPWYFQADAMFLKRDAGKSLPVATVTDTIPPDGGLWDIVGFSTGNLDRPFRAGTRALIGRTLGSSRWQIDFTYFWLDSWDSSASIHDTTINDFGSQGNLFSPFSNFGQPAPLAGFDYNDFVSIREISQLQNGELNFRYLLPMPHECLTAKFILGIRYMSINEQFDYYSTSNVPTPAGAENYVSTLTRNSLIGPQLGGDLYFYAYQNCWINFEFKGAICNNHTVQHTHGTLATASFSELHPDGLYDLDSDGVRDATSFVGDLNLSLVWQLTPHCTTRLGYQAIWVTNTALAARNYSQPASVLLTDTPAIDTNGNVVYHGPHAGLEFTW